MGCLSTSHYNFVCESSFYFVKDKYKRGKRRIRLSVNGLCMFKKLLLRFLDVVTVVRIRSHQSHFESPTPISSFPFLNSHCKRATRLLLNYSPRSDVWAVNHFRFHTDRRGVHVLIPSADWAQFPAAAAASQRCAPWRGGVPLWFIPGGSPALTGSHSGTSKHLSFPREGQFSYRSALLLALPLLSESLGNWKTPCSLCISRT